jgi:hypothetical protein
VRYRLGVRRRTIARGGAAALLVVLGACAGPPASQTPGATGTGSQTAGASADEPSATPQASGAQAGWRQLAVEGPVPAARQDHTWTVTPDGATAYLFGGQGEDGAALDDLWAFDLATATWASVEASGPPARFGHNAAWVDGVGLVIFAGQAGTTFFNDLWALDPASDTWRELPAGGDPPVARYGSCAAVGPDGRLWISHGFTSAGQRFADTRAYDFATGAWTDETPAAERPIERCLHACWWTQEGSLALYAGQTNGITALGDLWQLTPGPRPGTNAWVELAEAAEPAARNLYAAARFGAETVTFGGQALDGSYLADVWLLPDEGAPTAVTLAESPPGRSGAELIGDTNGGRLLLFGGRNGDATFDDLWELVLP